MLLDDVGNILFVQASRTGEASPSALPYGTRTWEVDLVDQGVSGNIVACREFVKRELGS